MAEIIKEYWAIIAAGLASVAWLVRLESQTKEQGRDIRRLWKQREEDMEAAKESRADVHKLLDELRADVKEILKQLGGRG